MSAVSFRAMIKELSARQLFSLLSLLFLLFASFASYSVMAPFFPNEAAQKGMSESVAGFVFSVYALVLMIMSSVIGKLLPQIGTRFALISGILFVGICNILLGALNHVTSTENFTLLCFVVRSFEAMGAASMNTAANTYIMKLFPHHPTPAFGLIKTMIGIGLGLGPAIGAGLYAASGFGLPFFVLGSLVLINAPICYICFFEEEQKRSQNSENVQLTFWKLLTIPGVMVECFVVLVISQNFGFLNVTLSPHLLANGIDSKQSGIVFFTLSSAYALFSFVFGIWFSSSKKYVLTLIGILFTSFSFILLGPAAFIPLPTTFWLTCVAATIFGVATSMALTPSYELILLIINRRGYINDVVTYGLISGVWSSMWSLGYDTQIRHANHIRTVAPLNRDITGPAVGGIMAQYLGFKTSATIVALFTAATAIILK